MVISPKTVSFPVAITTPLAFPEMAEVPANAIFFASNISFAPLAIACPFFWTGTDSPLKIDSSIKKFSSLKKEEPKTDLRRLSNRMIYELEMPEVHSINDVSIVKLETTIS